MPDAAGDLERAKASNRVPFEQVRLTELRMTDPSTLLVIIGNGFDIMHGVKSSYRDFEKTIGRRSPLRFYMETYLDVGDIWANLEESLGRLNEGERLLHPRLPEDAQGLQAGRDRPGVQA